MMLSERLEAISGRMDAACAKAGRAPESVKLVGVSKTFPLERLKDAAAAGLTVFGENKAQELASKCTEWADPPKGIEWHFIGHLQRNKASLVAAHANVFHALDSVRLARALQRQCEQADRTLTCFLQVNVSGEESKFGVDPSEVGAMLAQVAEFDRLDVRGLMTLAAPTPDPEDVRPQFARLRELARHHDASGRFPLEALSMGMSGDFEVAIEEGATHVRIGSAIFGSRY
ncbi:MAG: YggS family pyridoxal phosphate-dependent enzyme [Rhodothermales bacterium]|nr:YggS family pyridoxal phosphate-dependent enzyme [Rhodothermales bacterium]